MVREFSGFEGVGFALILYPAIAVGFILGLLVLIPIAVRMAPAENRPANKSVRILLAATLFGPAYCILLGALFASDSIRNSRFVQYVGVSASFPIPTVSLILAIIGLFLAFRSRIFVVKLGASVLAGYFVLEFIVIAGMLVPSFGRIFDML